MASTLSGRRDIRLFDPLLAQRDHARQHATLSGHPDLERGQEQIPDQGTNVGITVHRRRDLGRGPPAGLEPEI